MKTKIEFFLALFTLIAFVPLANGSPANVLYGAAHVGPDGPSTLYTIDPLTGAAIPVGPIGFERVSAMDFDQNDILYAIAERADGSDEQVLITIDVQTGAGTEIGPNLIPNNLPVITGMAIRPSDNTAFVPQFRIPTQLATVDLVTGLVTRLPGSLNAAAFTRCNCGWGFAFDPDGNLVATVGNGYVLVDQINGNSTLIAFMDPGITADFRINAIDFEPGTGVLFGSLPKDFSSTLNRLVTIDTLTGTVTVIGETVLGLDAIAFLVVNPDSDGDGVTDDVDFCPDSILTDTVIIDGIDSGVTNMVLPDGCSIADLMATCAESPKNHGAYVSCVAHLTNSLRKSGDISQKDKGKLQSAAAQSDIGK